MSELTNKNFGLLIAYVLPGFLTLLGISRYSQSLASLVRYTPHGAPTVAGFLYITLGSLLAGLTISALRWATIDTFHHVTGLKTPDFEFSLLDERLEGFLQLATVQFGFDLDFGKDTLERKDAFIL